MCVKDWIPAWATVAMVSLLSHTAQAARLDWIETPLQLEAPEKELPYGIRFDDLQSLSQGLWAAGCRTRTCTIWLTTADMYYDSYIGRGPQGSDCISGLRKCPDKYRATSKRLNLKITAHSEWRARFCEAIAVVASHDDGTAAQTHPDFGAYTLDLARRLTTPKLACLTTVWRAFQPSAHRVEALRRAISLCHYEGASARECAKLHDVAIE